MPSFAYSGRTRGGQPVSGQRVARQHRRGGVGPAPGAGLCHQDRCGQGTRRQEAATGQGRAGQEPGDLHAAVLRDDRCRSPTGAVSGDPRESRGRQEFQPGHSRDTGRRRGRLLAGGRHAQAPGGVRHAVYQHDGGRRGRGHPRYDSEAASGLHREERQAQGAGHGRHDLPDRGHGDRRDRRRRDPLEGHPDVRQPVRGSGRRPAAPHHASSSCSATRS